MSARVPREGYGPTRLLLVFGLVLLGLVGVGRLAMEAWLVRSAPESLPSFGARTDEASPFLMVIIDGLREPSAWATDDPPMPWFQSFAKRGRTASIQGVRPDAKPRTAVSHAHQYQ